MTGAVGHGFLKSLSNACKKNNSFLLVGVDIEHDKLPEGFRRGYSADEKGDAITDYAVGIMKATAPFACAFKPNKQFFWAHCTIEHGQKMYRTASKLGIPLILDIKGTDVFNTNRVDMLSAIKWGCDAVTISPFPGYKDGMEVFFDLAREHDKGIFPLIRMSSGGSADFQDAMITRGSETKHGYEWAAEDAVRYGATGGVVGATALEQMKRVRKIVGDNFWILSPGGFSPQKGDALGAYRAGCNSKGEGIMVLSSRDIDYPWAKNKEVNPEDWREAAAEAASLRRDQLNEIREQALAE